MGLFGDLIKIIGFFLSQRSFRGRQDGVHFEWTKLKEGVPQGAVLSPILFNLYTSDLPTAESTQLFTLMIFAFITPVRVLSELSNSS